MATSSASPVMQQQQTTTTNPMVQSGAMNGTPDTSSDQDGDDNFIQEFADRLQTFSPQELTQFTQLLTQADPKLIQMIVSMFPEFPQALQSVMKGQGGGSQNAEAAAQQGTPPGAPQQPPSQYPGTPMPSAPTGLRQQFMQRNSPVS